MSWNWQQPEWPDFSYDSAALAPLEREFLLRAGEFIGNYGDSLPISPVITVTPYMLPDLAIDRDLRSRRGLDDEFPPVRRGEL